MSPDTDRYTTLGTKHGQNMVYFIEKQIMQLDEQEGVTILVSEQNRTSALRVSQRAYVMEKGQIKWTGAVDDSKASPEILQKYMGV